MAIQSPGGCRRCDTIRAKAAAAGRAPLTRRQAEVLEVIKQFTRDHGYPPTRRELADAFGWRTAAAAQQHLAALERKGWLTCRPRTARAIVVV